MKTMVLTGFLLMVVACSGGQTSGGEGRGGEKQAELKRQAANSQADAASDVCADNDWYGDEVCDAFCRDRDVDCTLVDDDVMCLTYIEESNGTCDREPGEPCIQQDPDCVGVVEPTLPEPIICTAIVQLADGICRPDPNDPCVAYQDEDCWHDGNSGSTPSDPGSGNSGSTPGDPGSGNSGSTPSDPGSGNSGSTPSDPGNGSGTPTTPVPEPLGCILISELPDGVCGRDPQDPCMFQDPDCNVK